MRSSTLHKFISIFYAVQSKHSLDLGSEARHTLPNSMCVCRITKSTLSGFLYLMPKSLLCSFQLWAAYQEDIVGRLFP